MNLHQCLYTHNLLLQCQYQYYYHLDLQMYLQNNEDKKLELSSNPPSSRKPGRISARNRSSLPCSLEGSDHEDNVGQYLNEE